MNMTKIGSAENPIKSLMENSKSHNQDMEKVKHKEFQEKTKVQMEESRVQLQQNKGNKIDTTA